MSESRTYSAGIGMGSALAIAISYGQWHSVGWAILHGIFSWFYVIYALCKYASWGTR